MPTEHFIAGKDSSLESSISRMQDKLSQICFHVEERSWHAVTPESLLKICDSGDYEPYRSALENLYGAATLGNAEALLMRAERFFGVSAASGDLNGFAMHHRLLQAYRKVHRQHTREN